MLAPPEDPPLEPELPPLDELAPPEDPPLEPWLPPLGVLAPPELPDEPEDPEDPDDPDDPPEEGGLGMLDGMLEEDCCCAQPPIRNAEIEPISVVFAAMTSSRRNLRL